MLGLYGIGITMAPRKLSIKKLESEVSNLGIKVLNLRRQVLYLQEEVNKDLVVRLDERNNDIMDHAAEEIRRLRRLLAEVVEELEQQDEIFDVTVYDKLKKELRDGND